MERDQQPNIIMIHLYDKSKTIDKVFKNNTGERERERERGIEKETERRKPKGA